MNESFGLQLSFYSALAQMEMLLAQQNHLKSSMFFLNIAVVYRKGKVWSIAPLILGYEFEVLAFAPGCIRFAQFRE